MIHINTNYLQLSHRYLFAEIAQQVNEYKAAHPEANIIRLGIGDVTRPLPDAANGASLVVRAIASGTQIAEKVNDFLNE